MEFDVEEISPVKKKISVKVSPEEVDAAIQASAAVFRTNVELDGFRKGKAPLALVEKRFHDKIYSEARQDLINVHINDILQSLATDPVGGLQMTGADKELKKGQPFDYVMEFEVMPAFDLPNYEGLDVEQQKVEKTDGLLQELLAKLANELGTVVPVEGTNPPKDGQIANLEFQAYENGQPLPEFRASNMDLELGKKEALPEFEDLVKSIPAGHTAEKELTFPPDFIAQPIAGKTLTMKVTVNAVKERKPAVIDDKFAERMGRKNLDDLKNALTSAYMEGLANTSKAMSQRKLLDNLLKQVEFPLPERMVRQEENFLLADQSERLARSGRNMGALPREELENLKKSFHEQAERRSREKILLLAVARKENLEVSNNEVEREVYNGARKMGENFQDYYNRLRDSGLIFELRDQLLCDKAMDLIYERANITMIDPPKEGEKQDSGEPAAASENTEKE